MNIPVYLSAEGHAADWEEAIRLCGDRMRKKGCVSTGFTEACIRREKKYPTGLPGKIPVAIPHGRGGYIYQNSVCLLRLDEPVRFFRMDDNEKYCDTRLVINLAIDADNDHLEFLQKLMQFVSDQEMMDCCMKRSIEEIPALMRQRLG